LKLPYQNDKFKSKVAFLFNWYQHFQCVNLS
jgi:hypothetical protein